MLTQSIDDSPLSPEAYNHEGKYIFCHAFSLSLFGFAYDKGDLIQGR